MKDLPSWTRGTTPPFLPSSKPLTNKKRIKDLFAHQQKELKRIRNIEEGAYFNGRTYAWMFGLAFLSWAIIFVEITIWICIKLF